MLFITNTFSSYHDKNDDLSIYSFSESNLQSWLLKTAWNSIMVIDDIQVTSSNFF